MYKNCLELQVVVGQKPLREYSHNGRVFVEAKEGSEYWLRLKNNSPQKAMAIFSVDGLDVLRGKSATTADTGYIVDAYDSIPVMGYRITNTSVATFKFAKGMESYATSQGLKGNNGVLGVRLFAEKVQPPTITTTAFCNSSQSGYHQAIFGFGNTAGNPHIYQAEITCSAGGNINSLDMLRSSNAGGQKAEAKSFDLGTTWGSQIQDNVRKVEFEIGNHLADIEIFYASRESLIAMGVDLDTKKKVATSSFPKAFDIPYCQPPKNWRG